MGALSELVTDDRVILHHVVDDWREAIAAVAAPLVADGSILPAYVQSMIKAVEEFGPYIVLVPHVRFGHQENDPVMIVFCLAATDNRSHMDALKSFVSIAADAQRVTRLAGAQSIAEFQKILRDVA